MAERRARPSLWRLWRAPLLAWLALLLLLAATCTLAYVPMGSVNLPLSLAIAGVKAMLVAFVFMRLSEHKPLYRLAAVAGPAWLVILFLLAGTDYFTR